MKTIAILCAVIGAMTAVSNPTGSAPPPVDTVPSTVAVTTTTAPPTTTTTVAPATTISTTTTTTTTLPEGKCSEWFSTAVSVGWPVDYLERLGAIMWAESRCQPDVFGTGALGLTQIQWNAHSHWIKPLGVSKEMLYDPATNLFIAWELAQYADQHYGCWAQPWYMSGEWC